jgi:energy-coupling factor transporter ATP-binding protein EcfA2
MKRIKEVHINNLKFFPELEPIKIDGKNILLYGENGSGKSSFYWALYTLLESSQKSDPEQIKKYFNKLNPNSLVNIHAEVDGSGVDNSFIKIVLNDNSEFEVNHENTSINSNEEAKLSLLASDFLNYRLLQRTHTVRHTENIDLFSLFEEAVFGYVQFSDTNWHNEDGDSIQLRNAGAIYRIVKSGPEKKYPNKNEVLGYPQKADHSLAFFEFTNLIEGFLSDLKSLIGNINLRANPIIKEKLKFNISFRLELEELTEYVLRRTNYSKPEIAIRLIIEDFNGTGPVIKPQSFLNEARLSAVALAIRLAILEQRLQDAPIKILVLDDLMISLDMSNRDKIVKLILEEYAWFYDEAEPIETNRDKGHQTFILTHDRSLFSFIKNDITNLPTTKKETWKLIEMYADDIDESDSTSFEKPKVFYEQNDLAIAVKHYKQHDYPAAANYLRKYCEEIFCNYFPQYCWKDKESSDRSNNKMPFQNILENTINAFWPRFEAVPPLYLELRKYLRILLNPLSHADVGVERYKGEIKRVIQVVEAIEKLHKENTIEVIVSGGEEIQIRQTNAAGDLFKGFYELSDSLYKLTDQAGTIKYSTFTGRIIGWEKVDVLAVVNNGTFSNKPKKTMQENHTDFMNLNFLRGSANWMDDLYSTGGIRISL